MKGIGIIPFAWLFLLSLLPVSGELVSHYQFDDAGDLGKDDGSFNLNGSLSGNAQFSSEARLGIGCLLLDGNGDFMNVQGNTSFSGLDDNGDGFSLAAWVKADSLSGVRRIFSTGMFGGFQGNGWGAGTSGASLFATTYGVRDFNADSNDLSTDVWHHLAYVFRPDAGQVRFYLDGSFVTTRSGEIGMNNTINDFIVGGIALPGNGQWFQGRIDDLRIYDHELSFPEITALANPVDIKIEQFFTSNSPLVTAGSTYLSWSVSGADSVTLDGGNFNNESVPLIEESQITTVTETTTFTLTATVGTVSVSREITVAVTATGSEPLISEFLADNTEGLRDENDEASDWIELRNDNPFDQGLSGWFLTDDPTDLMKWEFPSVSVPRKGYLLVYASNKDRRNPGAALHTNFRLSSSGEYLAIVRPDGTVSQEFAPSYPVQLENFSYGPTETGEGYFAPTPLAANGPPLSSLPPIIEFATENPAQPLTNESLPISATVTSTGPAIEGVTLYYRINYGKEISLSMVATGDGIYQTTIPASAYQEGDMVRWYVQAQAEGGASSRLPSFDDPMESAEYFGTVVTDSTITTKLPVLHWFVQNESASLTRTGTQGSLFYQGEFYDNVYCRIRGQSAASWPKHKFKFDFYRGGKFRFNSEQPRVEEFNLQSFYREMFTQSSNTSYMREPLLFKWMRENGMAAPESFHLHLRRNGDFYGLFAFVEQVDDDFLKRFGFNPEGEMYKAAWQGGGPATLAPNPIPGQYRKATAKTEPWTNFTAFCSGINSANRFRFVWDNVDVAQWINCLATMNVPFNHDQLTKNYYVYREPETGEWHRFPWDADQSFPIGQYINGENWTSPLYGDESHTQELSGGRPNPVWRNYMHDAIMDNPITRAMYLRRVKTLADRGLAENGEGTSYLEDQVEAYRQLLNADSTLDRSYWASRGVNLSSMQSGVNEILNTALPRRQIHLFTTYAQGGSTPLLPDSQPLSVTVDFGQIEYQPDSGNQDEEFIEIQNPNDFAVDLSNWTLEGGVRHTFQPGTVIAANQSLYLSPNSATFRQRSTSPTGGESLFVQGNYNGHISNLGELLTIFDDQGAEVASTMSPIDPTDLQLYLVISEIMYHPQSDSEKEFIELLNISDALTLDLSGVTFTDGIDFTFTNGTTLAPGQRIVINGSNFANSTRLSNGGESIKLEGPSGATIRQFSYENSNGWPAAADGGGASLVLLNPESNPDHNIPENWRLSAFGGGSPGTDDRSFFVGNSSDDLDGDGISALLEHLFGTNDQIPNSSQVNLVKTGNLLTLQFNRNLAAENLNFVVEFSHDLKNWSKTTPTFTTTGPYNGSGTQLETLNFTVDSLGKQFLRLKATRTP